MRVCALLLVAVAAACVPAAGRSEGGTPPTCGTVLDGAEGGRPANARDLAFSVRFRTQGPEVTWILSLRNRTNARVRLDFPSSMYANVFVHRNGETVYAWSRGKGFFDAFMSQTLGAHAMYTCSLGPERFDFGSLARGRWHVTAYLNTFLGLAADKSFSITDG